MVPGLDEGQHFDLATELIGLARWSRNSDVACAIAEVLAEIRRADEAKG